MSPQVIQQATAHGRHLFAANDPLSQADRALAAQFDGPLEGEPTIRDVIAEATKALDAHGRGDAVAFRTHADRARQLDARLDASPVSNPANT